MRNHLFIIYSIVCLCFIRPGSGLIIMPFEAIILIHCNTSTRDQLQTLCRSLRLITCAQASTLLFLFSIFSAITCIPYLILQGHQHTGHNRKR